MHSTVSQADADADIRKVIYQQWNSAARKDDGSFNTQQNHTRPNKRIAPRYISYSSDTPHQRYMTLIAGIVGRSPEWTVPEKLRRGLAGSLSRHPGEQLLEIERIGAYFIKVDVGAYDTRNTIESSDGSITIMTGDPLLAAAGGCPDRYTAALQLHNCAASRRTDVLRMARGVFSGANFDPATRVLSLYTDKLGLRPIYYTIADDYVVFASVLRVLEAIPHHQSEMDARGVTEIVTLGIPLGTRTPYAHVRVLDAAELLHIEPSSVQRTHYWNWNTIAEADVSKPEELLDRAYDSFIDGVRQRIGRDKATASYLSGGLDSRCVVAALRALGLTVHTFTFADQPNEDQRFAAQFAAEVGSLHNQVAIDMGAPMWGPMMAKAWSAVKYGSPVRAEHPQLVWTGDGGSVGTGFVYLSDLIVTKLRENDVAGAVHTYLEQQRAAVPTRFLSAKAGIAFDGLLEQEITTELNGVPCDDPGRSFYFFLLVNDQRRHLSQHFEDIDLHRLEYQMPFFDSEFLAIAASIPLDWGLRHRFYTDWLSRFPSATTAVPWQTYPGHIPCTLDKPDGLAYQWDETMQARTRRRRRLRVANIGLRLARSRDFPSSLFTRRNLTIAALLHAVGLRDYEYVVRAAETYYGYWIKAGKRYSLDVPSI